MPPRHRIDPAQWVTVSFRPALVLASLVAIAGCSLDEVSAGVEVVPVVDESRAEGDTASSGRSGGGSGSGVDVAAGAGTDVVEPSREAATDSLGAPLPATVAVVGDSLTLSAEGEITQALTELGLEVLVIDGIESRRMVNGGRDLPAGTDAIDEIVESGESPELWIVALGTNDVGAQVSSRSFADDVAEVLTRIPAGAPVIWVDVWIRDRAPAAAEANRTIRSVTAMRPATLVVDWYRHGEGPGVISRDGVHLTDDGQRLFAATMAAGVESMFAG